MHDSVANDREWSVLKVPGTIGAMDAAVTAQGDDLAPLQLDLSGLKFIEIASLVYLVAVVARRQRLGILTRIRLPEMKRVRDLLRGWGFQAATEKVTGLLLRKIVHPDDLRYFGENRDLQDQAYSGRIVRDETGAQQGLLGEKHFPMHVLVGRDQILPEIANFGAQAWRAHHIHRVLKEHLADKVSSKIVFEALMNAVYHPKADSVILASSFDSKANMLTLIVWDDGFSIVETLSQALREGGNIHFSGAPRLSVRNNVVLEDPTGNTTEPTVYVSDYIPDKTTPPEILLLASTFPGITRDPLATDTRGRGKAVDISVPGMGLYLLTNQTVNGFGGEVAIRSGEFFMNIKASATHAEDMSYQVKIKRHQNCHQFLGNMITVRLPLC